MQEHHAVEVSRSLVVIDNEDSPPSRRLPVTGGGDWNFAVHQFPGLAWRGFFRLWPARYARVERPQTAPRRFSHVVIEFHAFPFDSILFQSLVVTRFFRI
jgi:hypothetical protein